MSTGRNIYKAGKLLKISLDYDDRARTITHVRITGDFFLYPEEGIEPLQQQLAGTVLNKEALILKINLILTNEHLEPFGFNAEQLAEAILGAVKS